MEGRMTKIRELKADPLSELQFKHKQLERRFKACLDSSHVLIKDRDLLQDLVETLVARFGTYDIGDLWTGEDVVIFKQIAQEIPGYDL